VGSLSSRVPHPPPQVLIVGGGDGGVLREVSRHKGVKKVRPRVRARAQSRHPHPPRACGGARLRGQ
jgi:spermidine synthase